MKEFVDERPELPALRDISADCIAIDSRRGPKEIS